MPPSTAIKRHNVIMLVPLVVSTLSVPTKYQVVQSRDAGGIPECPDCDCVRGGNE